MTRSYCCHSALKSMTLKSIAQINVMSSMGSYEASHFRITSSPTLTSVSSGATVMLVASKQKNIIDTLKNHSRLWDLYSV